MVVVKNKISLRRLKKMAKEMFGNLVKAVVDVEKEIMAVNGELHSDEEALLLKKGCQQKNLWGINLYPEAEKNNWIEFDSMINLKPSLGNNSRGVDNLEIRERIKKIVNRLVKR